MATKELNFPIIYSNDTAIGYGGNQEWFPRNWQRKAGCGSTSGANLAAYYASNFPQFTKMYTGDVIKFNHVEYLNIMEEMYSCMKPGPFGYPYVKKFAKQFVSFCKKRGVIMKANILNKMNTTEDTFLFVKKNIDAGQPISLLILLHRSIELRDYTWHWVTVTGYVEDGDKMGTSQIIISNYGKREMVDIGLLFEVHSKNKLRMVSFKIVLN